MGPIKEPLQHEIGSGRMKIYIPCLKEISIMCCCADGERRLTWCRVGGKSNIAIDSEYHVLDRKFRDGVVHHLDEFLCERLHKAVPIFLCLTEFGVVYCERF